MVTPTERVLAAVSDLVRIEGERTATRRKIQRCEFWEKDDPDCGGGTPPCRLSNLDRSDYCDPCKTRDQHVEQLRYWKRQRRLIMARILRAGSKLPGPQASTSVEAPA